jgi:hypothetical protein
MKGSAAHEPPLLDFFWFKATILGGQGIAPQKNDNRLKVDSEIKNEKPPPLYAALPIFSS